MTGTGPQWPRCAETAAAAGDPLPGTAPPGQRWLLFEHPGPWGRVALTGSGLDDGAAAALGRWARDRAGRVVLIRRPGRGGPAPGARRWFHADTRPGHEALHTGTVTDETRLPAVLADVAAAGTPDPDPLHLVCTHGRHDTCCAVRGRPLAAALEAADPGRTWECSHLGGCRFAGAVVLLPHGVVLGAVPPDEAAAVARAYRQGRLHPDRVRGRSALDPVVQAAQHHARAATGADGVDALVPAAAHTRDGIWEVRFTDPACTVLLRERRVDTGRPLTCAATAPGWMRVYDLVGLHGPTVLSAPPPPPASAATG